MNLGSVDSWALAIVLSNPAVARERNEYPVAALTAAVRRAPDRMIAENIFMTVSL